MSKSNKKTIKPNDFIAEESEKAKLNLKDTNTLTKIDDGTLIRVKSNVAGSLIYKNQKTGELTTWSKCGEIQLLTMGDLRAMKANQVNFFVNQWVIILGAESGYETGIKTGDIYKNLGITKYFEELVETSEVDEICQWTEDEIEDKVESMSDDAKRNLATILNECVKNGVLDSVKKIKVFEKALGCELAREIEESNEE